MLFQTPALRQRRKLGEMHGFPQRRGSGSNPPRSREYKGTPLLAMDTTSLKALSVGATS